MIRYFLYLMIVLAISFVLYEILYHICEFIGGWNKKMEKAVEEERLKTKQQESAERQHILNNQYKKSVQDKKNSTQQTNYQHQNTYKQTHTNQQNKENTQYVHQKSEENKIPDCLVVLGFTKEPENKEEIRTRFKKLIRIYHPDEGGTDEEFERVNKAYEEAKKLYHI